MTDRPDPDRNSPFAAIRGTIVTDKMRLSFFTALIVTIVVTALPGRSNAGEIRWSPDGKWLIFGQDSSPDTQARVRPGWLFRPESFESRTGPSEKPGTGLKRIWVVRADGKFRIELDRSDVFLSDPCWAIDGRAIVYTHVERLSNGTYLWTLKEVYELSQAGAKARTIRRLELPKDWKEPSPGDKSSVVLRQIHTGGAGLIIYGDPKTFEPVLYDSISQEVRARFPHGYNARIGLGGQVVAWLRNKDLWPPPASELVITNIASGNSKVLENFLADAIPVFSSDGNYVYAGRHQKPPEGLSAPRGSDWPDIARIDLKTFKPERYQRPIATPIVPDEKLAGFSVALDVDEEMLLCAAAIRDRPAEISWFQPKTAATYKRFPPLDVVTNATNLALSADEKLGLRLGTPESLLESTNLPAAICDPRTEMLFPLVPDDASVDRWIDFLVRTVMRNRQAGAADPALAPAIAAATRVSVLPLIEETTGDNPPANRLKRIGNVGLASLGFDPKKPDMARLDKLSPAHLEAACLFFALTRRYDAARDCLVRIPPDGLEPDRRARLYAVSAQLNVAAGKVHEGMLILEALGSGESRNLGQICFDGQGRWVLEPPVPDDWQTYLGRLSISARSAAKTFEESSPAEIPGLPGRTDIDRKQDRGAGVLTP
ncbi:hypothetical protein GC170_03290 [bacterium]|nr:hypothetical protein [bacterium]